MNRQWTKEEAWAWYNARPWLCGFNYVPSNCASRFDMWQAHRHDEKMPGIIAEIEKAHEIGYNCIRIIMSYECWKYEHDGYMERLEEFISLCAKNEIGVMIVFGNDCTVPKDLYTPPKFGEQKIDWGYHGGIKRSPHAGIPGVGYSILDEPEIFEDFVCMIREVVTKYRADERVIVWDVFNELGNGRRDGKSVPMMERFFAEIRALDPIQPLTACTYRIVFWASDPQSDKYAPLCPWERRALELSDVISYHDYRDLQTSVTVIDYLRREFDRPLFNTEWLNRIAGNCVQTHLPLFFLEKVACFQWGLAAGLNQTYEPWDSLWARYYNGEGADLDFTKWQHDVLRPNLRPYDPHEIELFEKLIAQDKLRQGKK